MRRILFYSEGWGLGGIERFIINDIQSLNPEEFEFDIFCTHDWDNSFDKIIQSHGGHRYCLFSGYKPNLITRLFKSTRYWNYLLHQKRYDIVHINSMNGTGLVYAEVAKRNNVPFRIVHSHNTSFGESGKTVKQLINNISIAAFSKAPTLRLSCSAEAGTFLFRKKPFTIIRNGIDVEQFAFKSSDREITRKQLNIEDGAVVIGSVGRLAEAKNPLFQLEILKSLHSQGVQSYLLLVGSGPAQQAIVNKADSLGLLNFIRLTGPTNHPTTFYDALDVFTLPSTFEGSPISMIEAIANGLFCICSHSVPPIPSLSDYSLRLSLHNAQDWSSAIIAARTNGKLVHNSQQNRLVFDSGYDISSMGKQLKSIYSSM